MRLRSYRTVVKFTGFTVTPPGTKSWFYYILYLWPWANFLIFLCLCLNSWKKKWRFFMKSIWGNRCKTLTIEISFYYYLQFLSGICSYFFNCGFLFHVLYAVFYWILIWFVNMYLNTRLGLPYVLLRLLSSFANLLYGDCINRRI